MLMSSCSPVNHDGRSEVGPVKRDVGGHLCGSPLVAGGVIWRHVQAKRIMGSLTLTLKLAGCSGWLGLPEAGKGPAVVCVAIKAAPEPPLLCCRGPLRLVLHFANGRAERWQKWASRPGRPILEQRNSSVQWLKQDSPRWLMRKMLGQSTGT